MAKYLYVMLYDLYGDDPELYSHVSDRDGLTEADLAWEWCQTNYGGEPDEEIVREQFKNLVNAINDVALYDLTGLSTKEAKEQEQPRYVRGLSLIHI